MGCDANISKVTEGEISTQTKQEGWMLSPQQLERYETFATQPADDLLKGLEPLDIFKWYMRAIMIGDFDVVYALFNQGNENSVPSRNEFLMGIINDSEGIQRAKEQSKAVEQNYMLKQRIVGDTALIVLTLKNELGPNDNNAYLERVMENLKGFGLTRNKAGVWKVNWMQMQ
jgi:hypothetical protein